MLTFVQSGRKRRPRSPDEVNGRLTQEVEDLKSLRSALQNDLQAEKNTVQVLKAENTELRVAQQQQAIQSEIERQVLRETEHALQTSTAKLEEARRNLTKIQAELQLERSIVQALKSDSTQPQTRLEHHIISKPAPPMSRLQPLTEEAGIPKILPIQRFELSSGSSSKVKNEVLRSHHHRALKGQYRLQYRPTIKTKPETFCKRPPDLDRPRVPLKDKRLLQVVIGRLSDNITRRQDKHGMVALDFPFHKVMVSIKPGVLQNGVGSKDVVGYTPGASGHPSFSTAVRFDGKDCVSKAEALKYLQKSTQRMLDEWRPQINAWADDMVIFAFRQRIFDVWIFSTAFENKETQWVDSDAVEGLRTIERLTCGDISGDFELTREEEEELEGCLAELLKKRINSLLKVTDRIAVSEARNFKDLAEDDIWAMLVDNQDTILD